MIQDKLTLNQVEHARRMLCAAQHVLLITHMSPDGDAMGSSLAMRQFLLNQSKQVETIVPNSFPAFLSWLPGAAQDLVYDRQPEQVENVLREADTIICLDFNEPKRIGILGERIVQEKQKRPQLQVLLIDHHLYPTDFADLIISYPDSPSTCELVYRLLRQMSAPIDLTIGTCLYTGMMTDTGNFSFNSNYPEMYEIVGELVRLGVDKDKIYNNVFNQHSADRMRLVGYCLNKKMRIFPEHHTALICLSRKELYRFNFQSGDAEGIVNMPLQIADVYYSCFMREDKVLPSEESFAGGSKIKVKISLRSQGNRPVNVLAHELFNGGGHANASGGEYYGPLALAEQHFLDHFKEYLL